ncbi:hypothetical protein BKA56DRAFT_616717 [Ilyonectria sp. MPI-CAGE-AT-0026]|nr:hypothetical protein BKA56DRAFT_616717 [Ilyonectria sp. MPI-CAGE-AT-0026]
MARGRVALRALIWDMDATFRAPVAAPHPCDMCAMSAMRGRENWEGGACQIRPVRDGHSRQIYLSSGTAQRGSRWLRRLRSRTGEQNATISFSSSTRRRRVPDPTRGGSTAHVSGRWIGQLLMHGGELRPGDPKRAQLSGLQARARRMRAGWIGDDV